MPKKFKTKIGRGVAIKKLESLIERTDYWNQNYASKFCVSDLVLVGSLARNEDKVGDIDVACQVESTTEELFDDLDDYFKWRKNVLGYAMPVGWNQRLSAVESDPIRFIRNRDGRIEMLQWRQVELVSLALQPIVSLIKDGAILFESVAEAIAASKPITIAQAKKVIANGVPRKPDKTEGDYWESYCITVNHLPPKISDLILERDGYREPYKTYAKSNDIPDRIL